MSSMQQAQPRRPPVAQIVTQPVATTTMRKKKKRNAFALYVWTVLGGCFLLIFFGQGAALFGAALAGATVTLLMVACMIKYLSSD